MPVKRVSVLAYGLKIGRSVGVVAMPASGAILLIVASTGNPILAAGLLAVAAAIADLDRDACLISASSPTATTVAGEILSMHRPCLVDCEIPSADLFAIELRDGFVRSRVVDHLDKSKAL
jgi:hypothetical protein